jgi:hypothetical protein
MRSKTLLTTACAITLSVGGCSSSTKIAQFANGQPSMAPDNWMVGTVDGYGLIIDRFGEVKNQFHAHEVGTWNSDTQTVTVKEHIVYLQGSSDAPTDRTWQFVRTSPGHWSGTAADVIGTATAEQQGNAWHLMFHQKLPVGGNEIEVAIDDWRWRESDSVAIDYSTVSKFGVTLATGQIAFVKSN